MIGNSVSSKTSCLDFDGNSFDAADFQNPKNLATLFNSYQPGSNHCNIAVKQSRNGVDFVDENEANLGNYKARGGLPKNYSFFEDGPKMEM